MRPEKLAICVDQGEEDDGKEPLIVVVEAARLARLLYGNVLTVQSATTVVPVPPVREAVSNSPPLILGRRRGEDLPCILFTDGLADLGNEKGNGVVCHPE